MEQVKRDNLQLQFHTLDQSIARARIYADVTYPTSELHDVAKEITLYELIKSIRLMTDMVREIDPERFGVKVLEVRQLVTPELSLDRVRLCPYCGESDCVSDHK
jgi:hypothetical protein